MNTLKGIFIVIGFFFLSSSLFAQKYQIFDAEEHFSSSELYLMRDCGDCSKYKHFQAVENPFNVPVLNDNFAKNNKCYDVYFPGCQYANYENRCMKTMVIPDNQKQFSYGTDIWQAFSVFVPEEFDHNPDWNLIYQFHAHPDDVGGCDVWRTPPFEIDITDDKWDIVGRYSSQKCNKDEYSSISSLKLQNKQSITKGGWTHFVINIRFDYQGDGRCQVWLKDDENNTPVKIVDYDGPLGYNDDEAPYNYMQFGYYYGESAGSDVTLYFDRIILAGSNETLESMIYNPSPVTESKSDTLIAYNDSYTIADNFRDGDEVGKLRTYNPSEEEINFKIVSGNIHETFFIGSTSGVLSINDASYLTETIKYNLEIEAKSSSYTTNCTIEVNIEQADSILNVNLGAPVDIESWNDFEANTNVIHKIKYSNGVTSPYNFSIWENWKSSTGGDVSGDCFNTGVIRNYMYTSDNNIRYFELSNLNSEKVYDIEILSSRYNDANGERGAFFFIGELMDSIDAKGNTCRLISFRNIVPQNNQIQIGYRKRVLDSDGHVNAIVITEKEYTGEDPSVDDDNTKSGSVIDDNEQTENNARPIIVLDYEESVNSGTVKSLDASGSFDPDNDNLSFHWIAPDDIGISNSDGVNVSYLVPDVLIPTTNTFVVEVSDGIVTSYKSFEVTFTPYRPEVNKVQVSSISASHFDGDNHPVNLLDGDPNTYWSANGDNQWIELELKASVDISHLKLAFYGMEEKKSMFDVFFSEDNENWEPLFEDFNSCGFSNDIHLVDCSNIIKSSTSYKYLKILGHGTDVDDLNSISELQVYGSPLTTTSVIIDAMNYFKVYPNPASQYFTVELFENGTVSLYDINGRNLFSKYYERGEHRIEEEFPRGCYIISLQFDDYSNVKQKLIIQ